MKKILIRMVALAASVCLMCGMLGGSTSHAAIGCKHSIVQQYTIYERLAATYRDTRCDGVYYEVYETRLHTYFGCKYCDYVICEGGSDELIRSRTVTCEEWWHSFRNRYESECPLGVGYYFEIPNTATSLRG